MTESEFKDWFAYHRGSFPSIDGWLAKIDQASRNDPDALRSVNILKSWRRTLGDVSLAAAKKATDAMARGDLDEPKSFDSHPKAIRRASHKEGNRRGTIRALKMIDGEPTYKCPHCLDSGWVDVFHPKSIAAAGEYFRVRDDSEVIPRLFHKTKNPDGTVQVYTAAASCNCEASRGRSVADAYDESKHIAIPHDLVAGTEGWDYLMDEVERRRSTGPQVFDPDQYQTADEPF